MKKGQVYEGFVERVDFPNKGIVQTGEGAVIVKNSLPGQKVKISVSKVRKGKAEGRLLEVTEQSPLETGSPCSRFGICGGCTYLSLPYEEQLRMKEAQVKKLLDGALSGQERSWRWEGIKGSPKTYEYRNKMEFSFGDECKDGPLALGMHKRGSFYDIVTTRSCRIVHPDFCRILEATLDYFAAAQTPYYRKIQHVGYLRHLLVRRAVKTGEILVALVTSSQKGILLKEGQEGQDGKMPVTAAEETEGKLLDGWRKNLQELVLEGDFAGILHITNDSLADTVQSDSLEILAGNDYFYEELLGLKFRITPFSFFQTNSLGAEVLYDTVRDYVGDTRDKVVFDLYSGTGTIAQIASPVAAKVVGVEIVEEAVEAARENARHNGLENCEFIAGDVWKIVGNLEDKPDLIILDPPREGIHPKALQKIIGFGVAKMVYVSCKPTSLARDLEVFLANGYEVERGCCVDMFPGTANVETVCLLSKRNKQHIEVKVK